MTSLDRTRALLHGLCLYPDDVDRRLIYADWCEENGEGERAEFIRIQIELARGPYDEQGRFIFTGLAGRDAALRRRERELREHFLSRDHVIRNIDLTEGWAWDCGRFGVALTAGYSHPEHPIYKLFPPGGGGEIANVDFYNGFPDHITTDCATWRDYGAAIVQATPVVKVTLSGKEPQVYDDGSAGWWIEDASLPEIHPSDFIPEVLWELLPQGSTRRGDSDPEKLFDSRQAALDALAIAARLHARRAARLDVWEMGEWRVNEHE